MLTGVKNLISDAFGREDGSDVQEDLRKLEFGDRNILLERGNHFFLAVVFSGRANKELASRIKGVINEIEEKYTDELKGWEGYTDAFEGIDEIIATLLPKDQLKEEEKELKEEYVEVPDKEEFYGETKDYSEEPQEEVYEEQPQKEVIEEQPQEEVIEERSQEEVYEEQPQKRSMRRLSSPLPAQHLVNEEKC